MFALEEPLKGQRKHPKWFQVGYHTHLQALHVDTFIFRWKMPLHEKLVFIKKTEYIFKLFHIHSETYVDVKFFVFIGILQWISLLW